jgi:DNA-binding response OmpR family regulator
MSRILVVEDESHIAQGLRFNLEAEGHAVEVSRRGEEALTRLLEKREQFDLLVLDVMLPGKDGFAVARELRRAHQYIPLLMLTARGRPEDVLKGFEAGADDYLPKPFNLDILIARIASLLRRKDWMRPNAAIPDPEREVFNFDGKTFDFQRLLLRASGGVFQLTLMEAELLRYLIRNSGRPISRKEILEKVWDLREDTDTRAIDNFIVRLRRYIEADSSRPRHLLTIRGLGYQFILEPKE